MTTFDLAVLLWPTRSESTGSIAALARALNVAPSHVSRMRQGLVGIGPAGSLRISFILGRAALAGLRHDGHGDLADVFEAFFNVRDDGSLAVRPRVVGTVTP